MGNCRGDRGRASRKGFKREESVTSRPAGIYSSVSQAASHGGDKEAGRVIGQTCVQAAWRMRVLTPEGIGRAAATADGAVWYLIDEELELALALGRRNAFRGRRDGGLWRDGIISMCS